MNIAEYSIRNKVICTIAIILILVGGFDAFKTMARLEDPEFIIRQAQIITYYPGATPKEIAQEVTEPLERAIQQMPEVKKIESTSSNSKSEITVEIKYGVSKYREQLQTIWQRLRNKISDAQRELPSGAYESIVADDFGDLFGMYYFVTGKNYTKAELRNYTKQLRNELLQVNGVARVQIAGEAEEEIHVEFSREKMTALGMSVNTVYQNLQEQNLVLDAGNVTVGGLRINIAPTGGVDSVEAIKNTLIKSSDSNNLIYLGDIAKVTRGYKTPEEKAFYFNSDRAIAIGISAISGVNVVELGKAITAQLETTLNRRPLGIEVGKYYHQGEEVEVSVDNFVMNVIGALVIVIVTLLIFMGLRSAIVIGAILILTIAATLAVMNLSDIPMHRISLGALIIALGMMVDNAIVVAEGILIGVNKGFDKLAMAKKIVAQTTWPLLGGTLVGCVAFAPIGFAPGSTAEYTGHLFWVILISLMFSWLFAITLTPLFCHALFSKPKQLLVEDKDSRFAAKYKSLMRSALNNRWKIITIIFAMFIGSLYGFSKVKEGFFPASTSPQIVVDFWLPEGTDIAVTKSEMKRLEKYLMAKDKVNTVQTSVGAGGIRYMLVYAPESVNSSYGQALILVDDYHDIDTLLPEIQLDINAQFPAAQAKVWRFQLGPGGGSKIEVEFSGPDPKVLRELAIEAKAILHADGGAMSIKDDWRDQVPVIEPNFSQVKARQAGVSLKDIALAIKTAYLGRQIGTYREGEDVLPIISTSPYSERADINTISQIQVTSSSTGKTVSLGEVVDGFDTVWRDSRLKRKDRIWMIKAQADPLLGELASTLRARLIPKMEQITLPDGYKMTWGGEYADSKESTDNLAITLPLGLIAMILIVFVLFGTVRQPLVIWLVVPLAVIGVVVGLLSTDMPMEFMGILGLLSLSGLLIKNAIVLVDQIDLEIAEGKPRYDAIVDAAASRVRPVSMGALTTVLGIIPLFFDAFFKSMSVVLGFGLTFATVLTLVIVPVLYAAFFRVKAEETAK